jgi:hypothetical protein
LERDKNEKWKEKRKRFVDGEDWRDKNEKGRKASLKKERRRKKSLKMDLYAGSHHIWSDTAHKWMKNTKCINHKSPMNETAKEAINQTDKMTIALNL